jgi:hypothetical protein
MLLILVFVVLFIIYLSLPIKERYGSSNTIYENPDYAVYPNSLVNTQAPYWTIMAQPVAPSPVSYRDILCKKGLKQYN